MRDVSVYQPRWGNKLNPERCCAWIHPAHISFHGVQCNRKPTMTWTQANGETVRVCKQHHPETVEARNAKSTAAYNARLDDERKQREAPVRNEREACALLAIEVAREIGQVAGTSASGRLIAHDIGDLIARRIRERGEHD